VTYFAAHVSVLDLLEKRFAGGPSQYMKAYEKALVALQGHDLRTLAAEREPTQKEHFEKHWLKAGTSYDGPPIDETLRRALIAAITLARDTRLPLGAIMVPGTAKEMETAVLQGLHQVTLVLLMPGPHPEGATAS
jgi:hypothetical protein